MKKPLLFLFFAICVFQIETASAQFEYAGGGIALNTEGEYKYDGLPYYGNTIGIDVRAVYDYSKKLHIVPDLKFYFPKKESYPTGGEAKTTVIAFNLNVHYILNSKTRSNYRLYLLGGAHISSWFIKDNHIELTRTVDFNTVKFSPGANVGAGMQFPLGAKAIFFAEAKYTISKTSQLVFTPGILFVL